MSEFYHILDKAFASDELTVAQLVVLLEADGLEQAALFAAADTARRITMGDGVHLRALVEISNYCVRNCLYCGLRRDNDAMERYRMAPDEVVAAALAAGSMGYGSVVLQAGEDPLFTADQLADVICRIKAKADVAITLSVGDRPRAAFAQWKAAGADRFLMRHETADRELYAKLHPGDTLDNRLHSIGILRELGYQVGAGMMVGLPGQTLESLAEDILLLKDVAADMVGLGPFIANPQTPMAGAVSGPLSLTLNALAVTRLVVRYIHMPSTTALGTIHLAGRRLGLLAGANVIMPVFTPGQYTKLYNLYPNKISLGQEPQDREENIRSLVHSIGRYIAEGPGHSVRPDYHG